MSLSRDLDAVDQFRWTPDENKLPDAMAVATRTRESLRRFGADPDAVSVDEAAARVSASVVRERIVLALDRLLQQMKMTGIRALLRRLDAEAYRDAVRDAYLADDTAKKISELAGQAAALEQPPGFVAFLGESRAISVERRRQLLQAAVSRRSGDLGLLMTMGGTYPIGREDGANERVRWYQAAAAAAPVNAAAHSDLGLALFDKGQLDAAIACYKKAIELDPKSAFAHNNLGNGLHDKGQLDAAIACFKKAIEIAPKTARVHSNLGAVLKDQGQLDAAIACYKKAIELDSKFAFAHNNLGIALAAKGQLDAAIVCFKKALELGPKYAMAHANLGAALKDKGQLDAAVACLKKAIEMDPKLAMAHNNLGVALTAKGQLDAAIACFKKAIELDPKYAFAHHGLASALYEMGRVDSAIACYRKAIELDPKLAVAHYNLGIALGAKGHVDEAIAAYKKAVELNPNYAEPHCNLGLLLATQGRFAESLAAYKHGHELGSKQPGWPYPSADWVREAETRAALEPKLSAFLKGEFQPSENRERLALADVCHGKKFNHTAVGLYAEAFAADPKLAADLGAGHRYNAACHAALAAAGQGEVPPRRTKLDDTERRRLRKQALEWLKADLAAWGTRLDSGPNQARPAIVQTLSHWQQDTDLAGIRDAAALAKLPADEQKAFTQLWADVAASLKKAEENPK